MTESTHTQPMQPTKFVSPDLTPTNGQNRPWSRHRWFWLLSALTLATLLVQGFHPLAEDGGLNAASIEFLLNRSLFPHYREFVTQHIDLSVFAHTMATLVRLTHLPLTAVLLLVDLTSIALTLIAARALLRRIVASESAQLAGVALLAAVWSTPIAATSLLMMDPYVTARSLSTPLSIFAVAFALDPWPFGPGPHSPTAQRSFRSFVIFLVLAILFHPLMAGYTLGLILILRLLRARNHSAIVFLIALTLAFSAVLQRLAPPESPNAVAAAYTRYYWFLSQWHWYELLGLLGPLLIFAALLRWRSFLSEPGRQLCRAGLVLGPLSVLVALLFAHESYRTHLVAHLQPLRSYLLLYIIMFLLLGAALQQTANRAATHLQSPHHRRVLTTLPALLIAIAAFFIFQVQRGQFSRSPHVELPWRINQNTNPWVRAFLWSRANTPLDTLFALDARYVNRRGEDAQNFRAISLRSAIPDFSKDGGEAADTPSLANEWAPAAAAQKNLSQQSDAVREARLRPFNVDWLVLLSSAKTSFPCPYDNGTVKVCRLTQ